jgi:outer membrane protein assembly factor BamB
MPLCRVAHLQAKAAAALRAAATGEDVPMLRQAVSGEHPLVAADVPSRAAAVAVLESLEGAVADGDLWPLTDEDEDDRLRVSAARALLNHGNRQALPLLGELLDSETTEVRVQAVRALRGSTGHYLDYSPFQAADERGPAADAWREWLAEHADSAELTVPLKDVDVLLGRTLVTNYTKREIVELDQNREVVWRETLTGVWGCQGLPNGHRLAASYTGKAVVEYDASGKVVWQYTDLPDKPYGVQRLPNGNTLVPCYDNELIEIRPDKSIAWQFRLPERAKAAQMLENGNVLLAYYTSGRVVEMNREGQVVWEVGNMQRPYFVQRLPDGHTLVANRTGDRVVEVDHDGKEVWSYVARPSLYAAQRLPGGNTLVVSSSGLVEVDRAGTVVWSRPESGMRGVCRY